MEALCLLTANTKKRNVGVQIHVHIYLRLPIQHKHCTCIHVGINTWISENQAKKIHNW